MEMSRLTRDGTAEPVSRDQILRHTRRGILFSLANHEQDWQPYPVDPYSAICYDHTYIHTYHTYIHTWRFHKWTPPRNSGGISQVSTRFSLSMEMSRLTRDGTAEPVSRDQILRHARGQGNINFLCSANHEQDWQPYPVDPYSAMCDDHTYILLTLCDYIGEPF